MMISTRGRYALKMMIDLAARSDGRYVPLKEIAERQEISEKYLESIVKDLVRAKYLTGLRGKGGGYRLARPAEEINVLDVLTLMEGTMVPVACLQPGSDACPRAASCRTIPIWEGLEKTISEYLSAYSVKDLMCPNTEAEETP